MSGAGEGLDRRELLRALLAAAGAAGVGVGGLGIGLGAAGCGPPYDVGEMAEGLLGVASRRAAWAEVGRRWLATRGDVGGPVEAERLVAELLADLEWPPEPGSPGAPGRGAAVGEAGGGEGADAGGEVSGEDAAPPTLAERIHDRVVAEMRAETTVRVDGWVLSLTEARIAALAALIEPEAG